MTTFQQLFDTEYDLTPPSMILRSSPADAAGSSQNPANIDEISLFGSVDTNIGEWSAWDSPTTPNNWGTFTPSPATPTYANNPTKEPAYTYSSKAPTTSLQVPPLGKSLSHRIITKVNKFIPALPVTPRTPLDRVGFYSPQQIGYNNYPTGPYINPQQTSFSTSLLSSNIGSALDPYNFPSPSPIGSSNLSTVIPSSLGGGPYVPYNFPSTPAPTSAISPYAYPPTPNALIPGIPPTPTSANVPSTDVINIPHLEFGMPGKPSYTYCEMLQCALGTHPTGHMTLAEIYAWLIEKFPYFTTASTDWKNSVRHNLSLNKTLFTHEARHSDNPGRGGFWKLNLAQMHQPVKPRERKRSTVRHEPYAAGKAPRRKSKLLPTPHPDVAGKTVPKLPPPRQVQLPQRHLDILIDDWELGTGVFQ